jgi:hypothetical protein
VGTACVPDDVAVGRGVGLGCTVGEVVGRDVAVACAVDVALRDFVGVGEGTRVCAGDPTVGDAAVLVGGKVGEVTTLASGTAVGAGVPVTSL